MKTRIAVGCGLLLTLGTAMAGSWIFGQGQATLHESNEGGAAPALTQEVTPQMIAMWKLTATSEHQTLRVPL